ncbi:MAG TPA: formyltransferase family protein [Candidatus Paceibacterota bacterium]|nr:formyltransferase family protein [Candidatus Paceibacterota bacterium]
MERSRIIVFASGNKNSGGSGFEMLVENSRPGGVLDADIVAVVSNHEQGGVRQRAERLGIPFLHFPAPWTADEYRRIVAEHKADFVALSGWLKMVHGLDPAKTINIHPAILPESAGTYGHLAHERMIELNRSDQASYTAVTMHFVTDDGKYDTGPVFFRYPVPILVTDDADSLASRVNKVEHAWQSWVTNLVVHGKISWDGKDRNTLQVPEGIPR